MLRFGVRDLLTVGSVRLNSVLNVKVGAFNQEKTLVGASVIIKLKLRQPSFQAPPGLPRARAAL